MIAGGEWFPQNILFYRGPSALMRRIQQCLVALFRALEFKRGSDLVISWTIELKQELK